MAEYPIKWNEVGKRLYETGTSKGVLFVQNKEGKYMAGVPFDGLIAVKQSGEGGEAKPIFSNNSQYVELRGKEKFKGTIEAYTYGKEFAECNGERVAQKGITVGQQVRKPFGLVYSTIVGNDTELEAYGEKIHFIYGARIAPAAKDYQTINEDVEALTFSWEFTTVPMEATPKMVELGIMPSAYISVNSKDLQKATLEKLYDKIYGKGSVAPAMPTFDELIDLLKED